jgi:hypothetical protein
VKQHNIPWVYTASAYSKMAEKSRTFGRPFVLNYSYFPSVVPAQHNYCMDLEVKTQVLAGIIVY